LAYGKSDDLRRYMFVRYSDITRLDMYGTDSIVGIKAPSGTKVEIPEPSTTSQHQIYLNSRSPSRRRGSPPDPIRVYLVRPEAFPTGSSMQGAFAAPEPSRQGSASPSNLAPKEHSNPIQIPEPPSHGSQSYAAPSWGPPGCAPPPMHHHEPLRVVGVTPGANEPSTSPIKSSRDRHRPHGTPQRATPPRASPPPTPFALADGRWEVPPTPAASGGAPGGFFSPPWSRSGSYFGPLWGEGSADTPMAIHRTGSFGRPHSPIPSQQDLFNMPLQSPAGLTSRGFTQSASILSPTVPPGFSPTPNIGLHQYRTTDAQFPLPTLHAEGRASGSRPQIAGEGRSPGSLRGRPRSQISELPDPAETTEPSPAGPASRVKPRRRR
jgi:hypothetical protein